MRIVDLKSESEKAKLTCGGSFRRVDGQKCWMVKNAIDTEIEWPEKSSDEILPFFYRIFQLTSGYRSQ